VRFEHPRAHAYATSLRKYGTDCRKISITLVDPDSGCLHGGDQRTIQRTMSAAHHAFTPLIVLQSACK